uniref:Secreted protein n=1 Tax=Brassica oleracea var. oleracea TaxID=109376 RepID=A0A0D2ZZT5_BRAOL
MTSTSWLFGSMCMIFSVDSVGTDISTTLSPCIATSSISPTNIRPRGFTLITDNHISRLSLILGY